MTQENRPAVDFERQRKRKVALFAVVLSLPVFIILWMLYGGGDQTPRSDTGGINVTVPEGKAQKTEANKQKAAERVRFEGQRVQTLGDNAFSLIDDGLTAQPAEQDDPMRRAEEANRAMQSQVRSFYAAPSARNSETEALRRQVQELSEQLEASRQVQQYDPLEMAEKQYQMAQKYLGGTAPEPEKEQPKSTSRRKVFPMRPVREGKVVVSTLNPQADFSSERNLGFLTAAGSPLQNDAPSVQACVAQTQVIRVGSTVRLRLLDAVRIDGCLIPRNTIIYGQSSISGTRLQVAVESIEYAGRIFTVDATAYDLDGQKGLNVPNSKERTALKNALASFGQSAGTSVNFNNDAGQQIVTELARDGVQATSRYIAEKLREVKITLKANHQLYLVSKE